jgi:hypothetical protein
VVSVAPLLQASKICENSCFTDIFDVEQASPSWTTTACAADHHPQTRSSQSVIFRSFYLGIFLASIEEQLCCSCSPGSFGFSR